jgi:O-antigen biosynthesis protein
MSDRHTINPSDHDLAKAKRDYDELARERDRLLWHVRALEREIEARDETIEGISNELDGARARTAAIFDSRSWRLVNRYARVKAGVARVARQGLRGRSQNGFGDGDHEVDYPSWVKRHDVLSLRDRASIARRIAELKYRPRISLFVLPSPQSDESAGRTIDSLRAQLYPHFDVSIISQGTSCAISPGEPADERFRVLTPEDREGALKVVNRTLPASGEFVGFVTAGDELAVHALYLLTEQLNRFPGVEVIYSDEDSIDRDGTRSHPYFKPDWSQDLLHSGDFLSRLALYKTTLLQRIGGLRADFGEDAFYDLALRSTESLSRFRIRHLPHVLYHRRAPQQLSTGDGQARALQEHFDRQAIQASVVSSPSGACRVQYSLNGATPLVSAIIATRDRVDLLRQIVNDILTRTDYAPLELIVVDNESRDPATREYLDDMQKHSRLSVLAYNGVFNFSAINNLAVRHARGEVLAFLNNDLKIISDGWLREMVSHAMRAGVGAVGAKLYYPDDTIQHAGIILGLGNLAGYVHRYAPRDAAGHGGRLHRVQDCSAVTAACMVLKRAVFEEVGGFDETNLPVAYNDVDLCLRLRERGYRVLWTPHAELYHLESASRPSDFSPYEKQRYERECAYFKARWQPEVARDPFYNPNLTIAAEDYSLAWPPRVGKPWNT